MIASDLLSQGSQTSALLCTGISHHHITVSQGQITVHKDSVMSPSEKEP